MDYKKYTREFLAFKLAEEQNEYIEIKFEQQTSGQYPVKKGEEFNTPELMEIEQRIQRIQQLIEEVQ